MVKFLFSFLLLTSVAFARDVVVILSESNQLRLKGGASYQTGTYLNEMMIPLFKLMEAGHTPLYFTPSGKTPQLDGDSLDVKYFNNDPGLLKKAREHFAAIRNPKSFRELAKLDLSQVVAVFVPGGHASMIDLTVSRELGVLLKRAQQEKVVTALICHGPIALLSAMQNSQQYVEELKQGKKPQAQGWIYQGYAMTIFSTAEEKVAENKKLGGAVEYYPADGLKQAGGKVRHAREPWTSHVMEDRELITAQNPQSVEAFAVTVAEAVKQRQAKLEAKR